jgi:drug/metabolite transporter (DMT)-like permease
VPAARAAQAVGFALAAVSAVLWGFAGVVAKTALQGALDSGTLLVIRLVASAALVGLWAAIARPAALRVPRDAWPIMVVLGLAIVSLHTMYYATIQATNVGTAVFLQYLSPTLIVLFGWATWRQPRERWSALAVVAALGGSWLLVASGGRLLLSPQALATGLGAAVSLAAQTILLEQAGRRVAPVAVIFWSLAIAGAASLLVGDPAGVADTAWTASLVGAASYMVLGATVIPMFLLVAAVGRIGAAKAGVVSTLEPVVAAAAAWPFLGERMSAGQLGGGVLILLAISFVYRAPLLRPDASVQTVEIGEP